jgi:hypothetical protein
MDESPAQVPVQSRRRMSIASAGAAVAIVGIVAAAIAFTRVDEREPVTAGSSTASRSGAPSHAFVPGPAPEGFQLVTAGTGTAEPMWGEDSSGTDEPYTVLERDGAVMSVSVSGFEGYQGGLNQASAGYIDESGPEELQVDGADALFAPADGDRWADLVVVRGDDLAVRVTAADATRDELVEMSRRTTPSDDRTRAPLVDPPEGWRVVGSVHTDALLALQARVNLSYDTYPGPEGAHVAGWLSGGVSIVAMILPAGAADLDALLADVPLPYVDEVAAERVDVNGRPGIALESLDGNVRRAVLTTDGTGAMVAIVVASTEEMPPPVEALVELAGSLRPADGQEWEAFQVEAAGGPGLNPDPGTTEITRGRSGDREWLLQTARADAPSLQVPDPLAGVRPDPCLKLSDRQRACADDSTSSGPQGEVSLDRGADPDLPGFGPFLIVTSQVPGVKLRLQTISGAAETDLHPTAQPGGWVGVLFVDDPGTTGCDPGSERRLEVIGAEGDVVACLG